MILKRPPSQCRQNGSLAHKNLKINIIRVGYLTVNNFCRPNFMNALNVLVLWRFYVHNFIYFSFK